jgi:hypothetical protein
MKLKTTTMSYIKVQSEEIVWCPMDDRHILIKKEKDVVIGLNYCQGEEIQDLLDHYMDIDHDLTRFYLAVKQALCPDDEVNQINEAIWAYVRYKNEMW